MDCSTLGFPNVLHHHHPELAQTHVHRVDDVIQTSHPLLSCSPPDFNLFQHQSLFFNESVLCIRWPKYWSFSFSISSSNEYSGLISFRFGWISLQSKGLSRVFSNTTAQKHQFFALCFLYCSTLTSIHGHWKSHTFDYTEFVGKEMSLLFTMLLGWSQLFFQGVIV